MDIDKQSRTRRDARPLVTGDDQLRAHTRGYRREPSSTRACSGPSGPLRSPTCGTRRGPMAHQVDASRAIWSSGRRSPPAPGSRGRSRVGPSRCRVQRVHVRGSRTARSAAAAIARSADRGSVGSARDRSRADRDPSMQDRMKDRRPAWVHRSTVVFEPRARPVCVHRLPSLPGYRLLERELRAGGAREPGLQRGDLEGLRVEAGDVGGGEGERAAAARRAGPERGMAA